MRLSDPTVSLTLPSLHDDTILSVHVYHPPNLLSPSDDAAATGQSRRGRRWRAAIVAHPYAPMGGDYNNHVVAIAVACLLRAGFVVTTFNFRGAHPSGGKTSWTAKPEVADYSSVVGFVVFYMRYLGRGIDRPLLSTSHQEEGEEPMTLLMAGYSYGSLVTTMLPSVPKILAPLVTPVLGSAAAEIILRAQSLASQHAAMTAPPFNPPSTPPPTTPSPRSIGSLPASPNGKLGVRVGGDEAAAQRRSNDFSPRHNRSLSVDGSKVRESMGGLLDKTGLRKKGNSRRSVSVSGIDAPQATSRPAVARPTTSTIPQLTLGSDDESLPVVRPAFMLISPLQGLIGHLAAMSFAPTALFGKLKKTHDKPADQDDCDLEAKLCQNPTLVIFGDRDSFVNVAKLRAWSAKLTKNASLYAAKSGSPMFMPVEVAGAGHAWIEDGVGEQLRDAVRHFACTLAEP